MELEAENIDPRLENNELKSSEPKPKPRNREPLCDNDQEEGALFWCEECKQHLCGVCDSVLHKSKQKKDHNRTLIKKAESPKPLSLSNSSKGRAPLAPLSVKKQDNNDDEPVSTSKRLNLEEEEDNIPVSSRRKARRVSSSRPGPGKHIYKILVVGNAKCGKSSLIQRYTNGEFADAYKTTIGADYFRKIIKWDDGTDIQLQLWDIAGQDRFAQLTRPYYRNAAAAVVVCDVSRIATLEATRDWKRDLDDKLGDDSIPVILIANKCDLMPSGISSIEVGARLQQIAQEMNFTKWFLSSAKENNNVEEAMRELITQILIAAPSKKEEVHGIQLTEKDAIEIAQGVVPKNKNCC